jgi:hypothetical protein
MGELQFHLQKKKIIYMYILHTKSCKFTIMLLSCDFQVLYWLSLGKNYTQLFLCNNFFYYRNCSSPFCQNFLFSNLHAVLQLNIRMPVTDHYSILVLSNHRVPTIIYSLSHIGIAIAV